VAEARRGEAAVVLLLIALLIAVPLLPPGGALVPALAVVALTVLAWQRRAPAATSLGLLFGTCLVVGTAGIGPQQVTFALGLGIYAGVVQRVAWLRDSTKWLKRGTVSQGIAPLSAAIVVVSAVSLLLWIQLARPDLADLVQTFIPAWSLWLLIPGAILLALINAAVEEAAYRGVALGALDESLGPTALAVLLQAAAFSTLHFRSGFPRGTAGVVLTFVYGLALGILRRRSGGLLAPWVTHVLTDIVIFAIVLTLLRG
jgi:membrane protease YdiL (CAAX protease family)